jgi:hypothetical protein
MKTRPTGSIKGLKIGAKQEQTVRRRPTAICFLFIKHINMDVSVINAKYIFVLFSAKLQ